MKTEFKDSFNCILSLRPTWTIYETLSQDNYLIKINKKGGGRTNLELQERVH